MVTCALSAMFGFIFSSSTEVIHFWEASYPRCSTTMNCKTDYPTTVTLIALVNGSLNGQNTIKNKVKPTFIDNW